jgi:lipoate-protein ligase B
MVDILSMTKALLAQTYNLENLVVDRDLLGLWCYGEHSKQKLASIGLAITRFTTYHGMALNFLHDERMFQAIDQLNPCGLPGSVYQSIEKLTSSEHHLTSNDKDVFIQKLLSHFKDYFNGSKMMLKQRSSDSVIDSISL